MTIEQFDDMVDEITIGQLGRAGIGKSLRIAILEQCLLYSELMPDEKSPIEVIGEQDDNDLPF